MPRLNNKFRNKEDILEIKKHNSLPKHYREFLSSDELAWLNDIHASLDKNLMTDAYRNSITKENNEELFSKLSLWARERFHSSMGDFGVSTCFFYESPTPASATDSTVHADIWNDNSIVDKTILIPLQIEPEIATYTIIFDQHYYHYGAAYAGQVGNKQKFGSTVILPENYEEISNWRPMKKFSRELYFSHLTHKPYANFWGLSVADTIRWRLGGAIVFDRTQLHCCDHYFGIDKRAWFAVWTNRGEGGDQL